MRGFASVFFVFALLLPDAAPASVASDDKAPVAIAIHGGAGTILRKDMTPEREAEYHAALNAALDAGHAVLAEGGDSLDAVVTAVKIMEDSPLFNAGKGAVFNCAGENEMDAAIMNGADLNAGAVAGVRNIRNPIELAWLVMEKSPHVLLSGKGAESFGAFYDIATEAPEYFRTERRLQQLKELQERNNVQGCGRGLAALEGADPLAFGTVGAVALDRNGNLAAATSTGGMTNKRFGRIGDVPVIGAGTYADNATAAISATGHGEYFIRAVVAHDIAARMAYQGSSLADAADAVIHGKLKQMGGGGGVIAVDGKGNIVLDFNTSGMYRGFIDADGKRGTAIYEGGIYEDPAKKAE